MIVNKSGLSESGMSLVETLIALFLFAGVIVSLLTYQQTLTESFYTKQKQQQAWRIGFQLLDSYPDSLSGIIPDNWQARVNVVRHLEDCKVVEVSVKPDIGQMISLVRLIC
ncbi:prepilin-type N-terminal cleavage/methylation domain-containing protein [Zophobihabitans entericus]|uniref:Prepilin peptidase dependent protein C-like C-terminal domain-containing protein n=1 Tax=Zophobihabitans entericus TaxID=1635327 RepID=A0A6G9IBV4_9GAMM|nr:prepilin-type N-terminal cleavage/methylation domain-containing protein [Zophobihabitans entericus]QIQ21716.1 hypothetical protein IPMB12_08500 [Zophobihabitans entericus]